MVNNKSNQTRVIFFFHQAIEEVEDVTIKITEATTKTFTITHQNYKRNITDTSKNSSKNTTIEIRAVTADQEADQDQITEDRDHDGGPTADREDHIHVAVLVDRILAADRVRDPGRSLDVHRARTVIGIDLEQEVPNLVAGREHRRNHDLVVECLWIVLSSFRRIGREIKGPDLGRVLPI